MLESNIVKRMMQIFQPLGVKIMDTINERIREVRKMLKMNQNQFAKELGVSRTHVSNMENGNDNPSSSLIKLLCVRFNIDETWLVEGIGSPMPNFDTVSDDGLMSKYNTMRVMLEQMLKSRTGEELKSTVETFSYIVSLLTANGLSKENRAAYLAAVCESISMIEVQEFATHCLGNYGKLGKGSYEMLLRYKTESEKRIADIEQKIREMNNIYLRQLQADIEL